MDSLGNEKATKFRPGDLVWVFSWSESARIEMPEGPYYKSKAMIRGVSISAGYPKYPEKYSVITENGAFGAWYYPDFLEYISHPGINELKRRIEIHETAPRDEYGEPTTKEDEPVTYIYKGKEYTDLSWMWK